MQSPSCLLWICCRVGTEISFASKRSPLNDSFHHTHYTRRLVLVAARGNIAAQIVWHPPAAAAATLNKEAHIVSVGPFRCAACQSTNKSRFQSCEPAGVIWFAIEWKGGRKRNNEIPCKSYQKPPPRPAQFHIRHPFEFCGHNRSWQVGINF